jgi:DNA-binding transcriptional LysR family regulator
LVVLLVDFCVAFISASSCASDGNAIHARGGVAPAASSKLTDRRALAAVGLAYHQSCVNAESILDTDLDIRSLRYFVAAAEELHFTRAAARLFVAQQALSREIQRFERRLGSPLFVRTTRRVTLTPEGRRLLPRARELVALHDRILAELGEPAQPILVDLLSDGRRTGPRVIEAARQSEPTLEFRRRFNRGVGAAVQQLRIAELDVVFGRAETRLEPLGPELERELIRFEQLAVMLPADHPGADKETWSIASLKGQEIDVNLPSPEAPEWADLVHQFLELSGAVPTKPHVPALGALEQAEHLVRQGLPILTAIDHTEVAGGVIRPLVDPVPVYPWSMLWRPGIRPAAITALREAAASLREAEGWLRLPADAWVPEPEASRISGTTPGLTPAR